MPPDGQNPQVTDSAPRPVLDAERQKRINKVHEIANQFITNHYSGEGREGWLSWVSQNQPHALQFWENYVANNPNVVAGLTPKDLRMLYAHLGFTTDVINKRVPLPRNPAPAPAPKAKPKPKPKSKPKPKPKPVLTEGSQNPQQEQEARTWFANVFQKFYGAGVGEPNGYQYRIEQDPQTGARQIRIFQDSNDAARSFVFVQQPSGVWELRRGTGQPIMGNVHYDPKQRRFFALGVSEDDILKAFQQSGTGQQQQPQQDPNASQDKGLPAGVTTSFPLGDGSVFTVGVDGMARVLRPMGENQWAVVMERPLQELLNLQQPSAAPAQPTTGTQSSDQIPSWMLLLMTLFLLMGRR